MDRVIAATVVVPGTASGRLVVSVEPLSFWGGWDPATGEIIDRRHPLSGTVARGRVLAIPQTRGSSTTTAVLLESIRAGTAPAAVLTRGTDSFLALASVVADELFGRPLALMALEAVDFDGLTSGLHAEVTASGQIRLTDQGGARPTGGGADFLPGRM